VVFLLVNIGKECPSHIADCIKQLLLFDNSVYFIADSFSDQIKELLNNQHLKFVEIMSLVKTENHKVFDKLNKLDAEWRDGFWRFAVERFFIIEDFLKQYQLKDVLHIEHDNLVYFNADRYQFFFKAITKGIALPADSNVRCIPSLVYIRDEKAIHDFCLFYNTKCTNKSITDMKAFSLYLNDKKCDALPVLPEIYTKKKMFLCSENGHFVFKKHMFSNNQLQLGGIFDAAAFGQYIGGIDPRNDSSDTVGFINETAVYSPSEFKISWIKQFGLFAPFISFDGSENIPLLNLHIHSKKLHEFRSDLLNNGKK